MPKIKAFTTKKKDWHKDLVQAVGDAGGSIRFPFEATGMKVEKDPFAGLDQKILKSRSGKSLTYSKSK